MTGTIYTLSVAGILLLAIQVVLPLLVALVTKWETAPAVKGVILLAFDTIATLLAQWYQAASNDVTFDWRVTVFNAVIGFVVSVATYFGIWKTTALRTGLQDIGSNRRAGTAA